MARPGSSAESGDAAAAPPARVVFVDTCFNTHLAIAVSDSDTVSELKKKIIQAHGSCFPELGEMKIDAVKVKRRGHSYHLFDSMLVTSAFRGVKKDWFLSVDATSLVQQLPRPVTAGEPSNAIVQIGGRHSLRETADASGNVGEASKGVMVTAEVGGAVNASGEMMLSAVKYSRLRDEGSPSEDAPRKKRRKTKGKEPDVPNSAETILLPSGKDVPEQIDGTTMGVDNGDDGNEPEKFVVIQSDQRAYSDAHDRIAINGTEKADDALVEQAVKEKGQADVDSVEGNDSLPLVTVEHEKYMDAVAQPVDTEKFVDNMVSPKKRKKSRKSKSSPGEQLDISNPENQEGSPGDDSLIEPLKGISYDQSNEKMNDKKNLPEAEGKELAIMDANKESGKEQGVVMVLSPEITETAEIVGKKPKKGPKRWISKEKIVDQKSDRPEEEQTDKSEVEKNEIAFTVGSENFNGERTHEMGLSGEIAENAEKVLEKPKTRKRGSKEKSVDHTGEGHGTMQSHPSKAEETVAADQNSDKEPVEEMGALQPIMDEVGAEDNVEKAPKKKTRKGSYKEKKDDQLSHKYDKEQKFASQADERDTLTVVADGKDHGNEIMQMLPMKEISADTGNIEEKKKDKTKRRSSKEKNVGRFDKEEGNSSRAGIKEIMATPAAESKAYEQRANEMEELHQVAEKLVHADDGKDKRKKTRRRSLKAKNANQSSDVDKEEVSFSRAECGEAEPNVSKIYQLSEVAEELVHENIGQEEGKKRTTRQSPRKNNADQPSDRIDKNQSDISQEKRLQSLLKIIQKSAEPENNDDKTQERTNDWVSKDIDQSSDITEKEENRSQGEDGSEPAVINAENSSKQDPAANNEKAGKRSKSKQSSKKSTQSKVEKKDLLSSHSTMNEDTSNLGNSIRTAKPKMPESANAIDGTNDQDLNAQSMAKVASGPTADGNSSHAPMKSLEANYLSIPHPEAATNLPLVSPSDEANNSVDELHGKENINFREYFVPPQSPLEVAPSGNSSFGEGTKGNRAGSDLKVKRGKRKAASSAMMESLPLNEQTGKEKTRPSESNKLASPVKKLRKTPGSGSQASTFPKPKELESHANPDNESGNSAASVSGLKKSKKPKRDSKKNSSTDHFRVAIRKPSSANKNMEEAVGGSGCKKSLLSLSGAIFREESSGSSKHEGDENSDASTRTPSDNLLSDYSDTDTNKNLNTLTDGSRRVGGHSKGKSSFKDVESLGMRGILRNSSGYKKAKLAATASQLNDSESQPPEFVPDSQANE